MLIEEDPNEGTYEKIESSDEDYEDDQMTISIEIDKKEAPVD